jgi:hypothetical protein
VGSSVKIHHIKRTTTRERPYGRKGTTVNEIKWGVVGGGILMAIGSFLPWAQAGIFSVAGTSGDGVITLVAGIVVALIGVARRRGVAPGLLVLLVGILGLYITYGVYNNLSADEVGTGIFVAGLGSLVAALASIDLFRTPKPAAPPAPAPPA